MQILLANPRGFCAGVDRAISIVENALAIYGAPIYVRHEVVHNRYVVDSLRERGAIFIEQISEVPDGAILIFSAHGVSQAVRNEAKSRDLTVFDATCPLVTKVHMEVARASRRGEESILIGHAGHPEVEGTMGQYSNPEGGMYLVESPDDVWKLTVKNEEKLSFMTQTTLSVDDTSDVIDALRKRFPKIVGPRKDDICYATTNRQEAVRALAEQAEVVLVVGSKNSSNSNRLAELAQRMGKRAFLIDDAKDIQEEWVKEVKCVGVTAGASAPDILVQNVVARLQQLGGGEAIPLEGREENIVFEVPKELRVDHIRRVIHRQRWFFAGIAIGISVILAVMMYRSKATQKLNNIAYALIIGGALGNLFDRLWHGFVVDMIDFYVGDWHFATFNLADTAICVGAALIVLEGFLPSRAKKQ